MLIAELMGRVIASDRRITRIYLCDEEYRQVIREADMGAPRFEYKARDRRVQLAGAMCYRLSEIKSVA